jgi:hypothetical protein
LRYQGQSTNSVFEPTSGPACPLLQIISDHPTEPAGCRGFVTISAPGCPTKALNHSELCAAKPCHNPSGGVISPLTPFTQLNRIQKRHKSSQCLPWATFMPHKPRKNQPFQQWNPSIFLIIRALISHSPSQTKIDTTTMNQNTQPTPSTFDKSSNPDHFVNLFKLFGSRGCNLSSVLPLNEDTLIIVN